MNFWPPVLGPKPVFPDPRHSPRHGPQAGLVAVGGDLSVPRLLAAYRNGIFPWSDEPVLSWWSPDPRAIFELDRFHVPRSLARVLRSGRYTVTVNRAFRAVMEGCAAPAPGRETTWISPAFVEAYTALHRAGHAHSVECWLGDALVGGVYGVALGGFFAAESMFHRASDASKVALTRLVERLRERAFGLLDIQTLSPVTQRLGAVEIPRADYLWRLRQAVARRCTFADAPPATSP